MRIGVVGVGVFGLAAAVYEQGDVPHPAASSTDESKGMRRMWYASDDETYVELAERAAVQWQDWEQRSGERFYHY